MIDLVSCVPAPPSAALLPGIADQDEGEDQSEDELEITKSEDEHIDEQEKQRKKSGIPEFDPDALPSSCSMKYMYPGSKYNVYYNVEL